MRLELFPFALVLRIQAVFPFHPRLLAWAGIRSAMCCFSLTGLCGVFFYAKLVVCWAIWSARATASPAPPVSFLLLSSPAPPPPPPSGQLPAAQDRPARPSLGCELNGRSLCGRQYVVKTVHIIVLPFPRRPRATKRSAPTCCSVFLHVLSSCFSLFRFYSWPGASPMHAAGQHCCGG